MNNKIELRINNERNDEQFYRISIYDDYVWVCNEVGMQIRITEAYNIIDKFFKENF